MQNVRVLSNHKRALLSHRCTFREKIARFNISQFYVIKINHWVKNDYWHNRVYTKRVVFHHLTIITVSKYYGFHDKNFLGNHKCTASHYIMVMKCHDKMGCAECSMFLYINWKAIISSQWYNPKGMVWLGSIIWIMYTATSALMLPCANDPI